MLLPPRATPALPYAPVAAATNFIGRKEEEQQQEGTNAGRGAAEGTKQAGKRRVGS